MLRKVRLLILMMCTAAMMMAMAGFAYADEQTPCYLVDDAAKTNSAVTVKVVVESKQYSETDSTAISGVYTVALDPDNDTPANQGSLGANNSYYTVLDAMVKFSDDSSNGITAYDVHGNAIDSSDTYIYSMGKAGTPYERLYEPALPIQDPDYAIDGWMFRVNDSFPLLDNSSLANRFGAAISDTPIVDGDVIHFYWDYPYNETATTYYSANYVTADADYSNGIVSIQLMKSKNWFDNTGWNIDPFTSFIGGSTGTYNATIYNKNGDQVAAGTVSKATGAGSITCTLTSDAAPYYVKVDSASYKDVDGFDADCDDVTWYILDDTMAYAEIQ